eukprot:1151408-Pelagomonas_calceolata.AAC.1
MPKCKGCGEVMRPNHPSQTCKQHSSSCKHPREEEVIDLDDEAGSSRPAKQSSLTPYSHQLRSRTLSTRTCFASSDSESLSPPS